MAPPWRVALADKLDTLVGFWAIGEKPTGSGDPYQLRRAALGVIRIVLENDLRIAAIAVRSHRNSTEAPLQAELRENEAGAGSEADVRTTTSFNRRQIVARTRDGPARLLRRAAEGPSARQGCAPRPHRRDLLAARPGRPRAHRQARRGADRVPEDRRRRQPLGWRQARAEHPLHRGEEGQDELRRRPTIARCCRSRRRWRSPPRSKA